MICMEVVYKPRGMWLDFGHSKATTVLNMLFDSLLKLCSILRDYLTDTSYLLITLSIDQ